MAPLLQLESVSSGYGPILVLKAISLSVGPGEVVTIIGANGAGKTSILMCISGINPVWDGKIWFDGDDITNKAPHEVVRCGLVQVPEGRKIFPRLNVGENLQLGAYQRNDPKGVTVDLEKVFGLFPILKERRNQAGGTLSGGEQQMLAIGRALMASPKLILMDEPSMGIAPILVGKIFEALSHLSKGGMTILLVEQNAHLALSLAKRGYVLETGSIILDGQSAELLSHPRMREAYLGE